MISNSLPENVCGFETNVKNLFGGFSVINEFQRQFPNYALTIELNQEESQYFERLLLLRVRISLLTMHYTYFYEEHVTHKTAITSNLPVESTVISSQVKGKEHNFEKIQGLKKIIEGSFPGYAYVNHEMLFKTKVESGTPYGTIALPINKQYSLYQFLFDNELHMGLQIAQ